MFPKKLISAFGLFCALVHWPSFGHAAPKELYCDTAVYPPLKLEWSTRTDVSQVRGVFPHPVLVRRAALVTDTGVFVTDDAGRTWKKLAGATVEKVGVIRDVAFHPLEPDTFYLGSESKGVWATNDNGATFRQVGSKATGMASDSVTSLLIYPGDVTRNTLVAVHGDASTGLSRTRDGGKTWDILNPEYNFRRVIGGNGNSQQLFFFGSVPKEPDVQNFYACNTIGELPSELVRDVVPTDMICVAGRDVVYFTTSDSGLYRVENNDLGGATHDVKKLQTQEADGWSSVAQAWGPNADSLRLFLYDPSKAGLVVTGNELSSAESANDGLLVSPLVKEGAAVRPNANGTLFYAVANGALMMAGVDGVPAVDLNPPVFTLDGAGDDPFTEVAGAFTEFVRQTGNSSAAIAKEINQRFGDLAAPYHLCELTITARVPGGKTPSAVMVDLSRFNGAPDTPLYDDGRHGDGAANDGVYGLKFAFLPKMSHRRGDDWRSFWPGRVPLGVSAVYPDGHREGAVGVVAIYRKIADYDLWEKRGILSIRAESEGDVSVRPVLNPQGSSHEGAGALRVETRHGPWSVLLQTPYNAHDITSYAAVSFWIKLAEGPAPGELYVQLRDQPEYSEPTTTGRVPVSECIREGGISGDYRRVIVPLGRLLAACPQFQTGHLSKIIITGDAAKPGTLLIDGPRILATLDDQPAQQKGASAK